MLSQNHLHVSLLYIVLLTGTKYGCGGGGCGACTVMVSKYDQLNNRVLHYTVNACLQPICTLHGAAVVTVEGIGSTKTKLHPVQERIAKAHGSQCGFCTPGMVMSMYTLLRNKPHPTMEDIREALGGNLCRCTGYRPIIDGFKTFCDVSNAFNLFPQISEELFHMDNVLPLDPSQDLIFPPELMIMGKKRACGSLCFQGDRLKLISPVDLTNLLELKTEYPEAPVVVGNTTIGPNMQVKGVHHPLTIYLFVIYLLCVHVHAGVSMGAVCTLSSLKEEMERAVREMEAERTRGYQALLQTLQCLAGKQIRNMATIGGNILSANPKYDLNSVLAALDCTLQVMSKENGTRAITLNEELFTGFGKTALRPDEVLLSIDIPYSKPWEFVSAFRQAQRREFAFSIVNAGMKVLFREGTNIVESLNIYYGGVGPTLVKVGRTCQKLVGRSWGEDLLADACRLLEEEVELSDSAHGGKVEYRKTLTTSFFFKFYMQVLQELRERVHIQDSVCLFPLQLVSNAQSSQDPVGHPMMHQAAFHQATGEAQYYDDIPAVQGELFVFMVTSTRAHAKIINIDPSEALGMTGVVTFLSAGDVPGQNRRMLFNNPEELFAEEEVSCVGQIIGAVVAESREQARRAAQMVKVTYQDLLPVFFTIEEAIQHQSFFDPKRKLERGDVDKAFETVDQILEDEIYLGGQEHFYMETQGLIAVPKGENGELELFVASQHSAYTQEVVGITLGIDSNKITCHVRRLGGAFGGKVMKIASLSAITATAAVKTGRPVRCVLERGDDMLITSGRHPFLGKYKVGYNNDGTIMAADITYYSNGGCTLNESLAIMEKALLHMDNGYKIPNLRGRGLVCKTYLPSYTAFRGFGGPQGLMVMESVLHEVAVKCGLPPQKVREINMYREEECYTHHKQLFSPRDMLRCWDECLDKAGYHDRLQAIQQFNTSNRWKKRGISAVPMKFGVGFSKGFFNQGAALVNIYKDGSVLVAHGGTEMGQGINTKALQIASRILKVPMSSIHIKETCTGNVPNAAPSAASFGTDAVGMAVKDACEKLMRRLKPFMENHPKYTWQQWTVITAMARFTALILGTSRSQVGYPNAVTVWVSRGPHTDMDWENSEGPAYYYFTFGACCSEVEIDCLTGDHKNLRTDIVMDVGRSLNPALDIGQIEGGFVQGIGLYTIEELQFSLEGVLMTRGPSQYKIPALCDVPPQFNVHLLVQGKSNNMTSRDTSIMGIGEPPVFLASTIFFAIKEAVAAARRERGLGDSFPLSSPATAERIRMACEDQFTEMAPSPKKGTFKPWSINI
uniref:xanthine dehydrogenase n=1 Tax=Oncorhynchus kisutch TaxID=8019 RepID=A0A8C7LI67_ONCKI